MLGLYVIGGTNYKDRCIGSIALWVTGSSKNKDLFCFHSGCALVFPTMTKAQSVCLSQWYERETRQRELQWTEYHLIFNAWTWLQMLIIANYRNLRGIPCETFMSHESLRYVNVEICRHVQWVSESEQAGRVF